MTPIEYILVALAAVAAGAINALAGGGTLITFPVLIATGVPAIPANVTNTVALLPGYLGGTFAQFEDLKGQRRRLYLLLPAAAAGGLFGGILLLNTGEELFSQLVPILILLASTLLAIQDPVRAFLIRRLGEHHETTPASKVIGVVAVFLAAIYGGYFGAGLSVIVLAALGFTQDDSLTRLNALKQVISFAVNVAAAVFFILSKEVIWPVALVMAAGALIGGSLGGRLAGRLKPATLRWSVVTIGMIVGIVYLVR